jgi:hypothetical protein
LCNQNQTTEDLIPYLDLVSAARWYRSHDWRK